jgi:uncharacterized membrane protein
MVDWSEFRAGLAETRGYLLAHHEPDEWDRCHQPTVLGRRVRLCARCSGVYPGIAAGLLTYVLGPPALASFAVVATLPLPALVDWTVTSFTSRRGYNVVRTATGLLLGYSYGLGLGSVFGDLNPRVILVGIGYAVVAAALLYYHRTGRFDGQ